MEISAIREICPINVACVEIRQSELAQNYSTIPVLYYIRPQCRPTVAYYIHMRPSAAWVLTTMHSVDMRQTGTPCCLNAFFLSNL